MNALQRNNEYSVIDGFLRRICKLLYFGIKPVFVFDGSTPQIKKKTLMMRRALRQKQQVNYNKAAEKLLHNIVKETLVKQIQGNNSVKVIDQQKVEGQQNTNEQQVDFIDEDIDSGSNSHTDENAIATKVLVEKYQSLLEMNDIDIDIFQSLDVDEQYEVIDQLKRVQRDVKRERFIQVQDDLTQFSLVQMNNFIDSIKEKQRQKEIMIKASEQVQQLQEHERRVASNPNLRFIYREDQNQKNINNGLPQSVINIIEKAKGKKKRGKGKNDIEKLIREGQEKPQLQQDVFNIAPLDIIRKQNNKNYEDVFEEDEDPEIQEKRKQEQYEKELIEYERQRQMELEKGMDDIFGFGDTNYQQQECGDIFFKEYHSFDKITNNYEYLESDHKDQRMTQEVNIPSFVEEQSLFVTFPQTNIASKINQEIKINKEDKQITNKNQYIIIQSQKAVVDILNIKQDPQFKNKNDNEDIIVESQKDQIIENQDYFSITQSNENIELEHKDIDQNKQDPQLQGQQIDSSSLCDDLNMKSQIILSKKRKAEQPIEEFYINTVSEQNTVSQDDRIFNDFDNATTIQSTNNFITPIRESFTNQDLERLKQDILEENIFLISELEKSSKSFSYFSAENTQELQSLLKLCGIPFIQAPFEAESQCAYLEMAGLVDGVITEDSDVLLFGARKVYRNIFERNKFAEKYDMRIIEREMGLDREDLIKMALFMGSDYTIGVKGIAAVNAIEIINSFPSDDGLERFKKWVDIKQQIIDQANKLQNGIDSKKKSTRQKLLQQIEDALEDNENQDKGREDYEIEKEYKQKHKNWRRHWIFPDDFPNYEVIKAYKEPHIDDNKEQFTWTEPAYQELKTFALRNLNWSLRDIDQYFNQVQIKIQERAKIDKKKGTLEQYFKKEEKFTNFKSQRVVQAVKDLQNRKKKVKKNQ